MPDNLIAWLAPHHGKTPIFPKSFRREFGAVRKAAGLAQWTHDVMRHSSVSYWMAAYHDEAKCAKRHGHAIDMMHKHYRASVDEKDGPAYWAITPFIPLIAWSSDVLVASMRAISALMVATNLLTSGGT